MTDRPWVLAAANKIASTQPDWHASEQATEHTTVLPQATRSSLFSDGPQLLINAGVAVVVQPGGSQRDDESIALANNSGIAMIFTGTRHFRH